MPITFQYNFHQNNPHRNGSNQLYSDHQSYNQQPTQHQSSQQHIPKQNSYNQPASHYSLSQQAQQSNVQVNNIKSAFNPYENNSNFGTLAIQTQTLDLKKWQTNLKSRQYFLTL